MGCSRGGRGGGAPRAVLPRLVLILAFACLQPHAAHGRAWRLEGELGIELESISESFTLPDTSVLDPDQPVEEQLESIRFRDRDTLTDGLLRLHLGYDDPAWRMSFRGRVTSGSGRTRETIDAENALTSSLGRFRLQEYFYGQSGGGESQDGYQNELTFTWEPPALGGGWETRWRGRWDRSRSFGDSLNRVFNYHRARGGARLRRMLGWSSDAAVEVEWGRKWMDEAVSGAYRSLAARVEMNLEPLRNLPLYATYRYERRSYEGSGSLTDSYGEHEADLQLSRRTIGPWGWETRWSWRWTDYDTISTIYFDNRQMEGLALAVREFGSHWTIKVGPGGGWLWQIGGEDTGSYRTGHLQLELGYDTPEARWFRFSTKLGRRDYQVEESAQVFVFEGYNLSLARSDYTYTSLSLLGEAPLGWGISLDLFVQYDVERHDRPEDDFTLSLLTLRLMRDL